MSIKLFVVVSDESFVEASDELTQAINTKGVIEKLVAREGETVYNGVKVSPNSRVEIKTVYVR